MAQRAANSVIVRFQTSDHPSSSTTKDAPRFKPAANSKTLEDSVTVEDPGAFNTVWSGVQSYRQESQGDRDESICPENNVAHSDYENEVVAIPQAEKPDF